MGHLNKEEIAALQDTNLSRESPFIIEGISDTQFSVARHYGGCRFKNNEYLYVPPTDELIRRDVVKWLAMYRLEKRKADKLKEKKEQISLF